MKKLLMVPLMLAALVVSACVPDAGTPPQLPGQVQTISRTALDFSLNAFDAALYGLDFAMDAKLVVPGSDRAKAIAAAGRKVQGFLRAAELARQAGRADSYEAAFANANASLNEFKSLLGRPHAALSPIPLTPFNRQQILARAAG